jgi:hypothetical protein
MTIPLRMTNSFYEESSAGMCIPPGITSIGADSDQNAPGNTTESLLFTGMYIFLKNNMKMSFKCT